LWWGGTNQSPLNFLFQPVSSKNPSPHSGPVYLRSAKQHSPDVNFLCVPRKAPHKTALCFFNPRWGFGRSVHHRVLEKHHSLANKKKNNLRTKKKEGPLTFLRCHQHLARVRFFVPIGTNPRREAYRSSGGLFPGQAPPSSRRVRHYHIGNTEEKPDNTKGKKKRSEAQLDFKAAAVDFSCSVMGRTFPLTASRSREVPNPSTMGMKLILGFPWGLGSWPISGSPSHH